MTLTGLRYVIAVAKERHFGRCGEGQSRGPAQRGGDPVATEARPEVRRA
jgi:hypothetical protein